jgi:Holliday junction resolvasome RuvABC endonuclease subunit
MARRSWFETKPRDDASATVSSPLGFSVERLESWQQAIEDGIIEPHEVAEQTRRVLDLLRTLEPLLDDEQHEHVTRVLEEWTVLQAMQSTLLIEEFGAGASRPSIDPNGPG